jgi:hypothetical protein
MREVGQDVLDPLCTFDDPHGEVPLLGLGEALEQQLGEALDTGHQAS